MAIREINLVPHDVAYKEGTFTTKLQKMLNASIKKTIQDIEKLDIFNFSGRRNLFSGTTGKRELIFLYASPTNTIIQDEYKIRTSTTMFGVDTQGFNLLLPASTEGFKDLRTPEGEVFAQHSLERNSIYILADVQSLEEGDALNLYKAMFEYIKTEIYDKKGMENSWKYTSDKDTLSRKFQKRIEESSNRIIADDKERLERSERKIHDYQREIKQTYDNVILLRRTIESAERNTVDAKEKVINELDAIAEHERVSDLRIENGILKVSIPDVYAIDKKDRRFYIGNFVVDINLDNSDVKFFGDNPRRSHWTAKDPHPHVNGRDGKACLGNIASTIAELCSYNELYALVMTCLDFLENANIDDSAGKNVVNWEQVDKDGKPTQETPQEVQDDEDDYDDISWECEYTGNIMDEDDEQVTVYTEYTGEGRVSGMQTWSRQAVNEYAIWNDRTEEYVTNDVDDDLNGWYEE